MTDTRTLLGVTNFWNVISNVPLLLVGVWGLYFLVHSAPGSQAFQETRERWPYLILFLSVALTSFGSAYYHLEPDGGRLVWDRLPISLGFMSLVSAVVVERIGIKPGLRLLFPLLIVGAGSVIYWRWSKLQGTEDLIPYASVQYGAMVLIVVIVLLFRSRYTHGRDIFIVLAIYGAAKITEVLDARIYDFGYVISGHTLKHLIAASAIWWLIRMLRLRQPRPLVTIRAI